MLVISQGDTKQEPKNFKAKRSITFILCYRKSLLGYLRSSEHPGSAEALVRSQVRCYF